MFLQDLHPSLTTVNKRKVNMPKDAKNGWNVPPKKPTKQKKTSPSTKS